MKYVQRFKKNDFIFKFLNKVPKFYEAGFIRTY